MIYFWGWYADYDLEFIKSIDDCYAVRNISFSKNTRILIALVRRFFPSFVNLFLTSYLRFFCSRDDTIIFSDDVLHYKISDFGFHCRKIILLRNVLVPLKAGNLPKIKQLGFEVYSFDRQDCLKFDLKYLAQFLPVVYGNSCATDRLSSKRKVLFVGLDKNRRRLLNNLKVILEKRGCEVDFQIFKPNLLNRFGLKVGISYKSYVQLVRECDILVDIVQDGQDGLTLRSLEAVHYRKKLITNHKSIKDSDIFDDENFCVLDKDDIEIPKIFLEMPYCNSDVNLSSCRYGRNVLLRLLQ